MVAGFSGQPEDDMNADRQAAPAGALHRIDKSGDVVAAIDGRQRCVMGRLQPVLNPDEMVLIQFGEGVQHLIGYAIRSRADGQTDNVRNRQRLFIDLL